MGLQPLQLLNNAADVATFDVNLGTAVGQDLTNRRKKETSLAEPQSFSTASLDSGAAMLSFAIRGMYVRRGGDLGQKDQHFMS